MTNRAASAPLLPRWAPLPPIPPRDSIPEVTEGSLDPAVTASNVSAALILSLDGDLRTSVTEGIASFIVPSRFRPDLDVVQQGLRRMPR